MPRVVAIPSLGEITFPDSMSDDDLNKAVKKLHDEATGPKKIGGPSPTPTLAAPTTAASKAPGGEPPPSPGAQGGLLEGAVGALQDVGISAVKTASGTVGLLGGVARLGAGGHKDPVVRLLEAGTKALDNWAESLRTEPAPKQPKIPILGQTPTEAIGSIIGGAVIPLPGGGGTAATIGARAMRWLKQTSFGTVTFTALQLLPDYLDAKTDAEKDAILKQVPQAVMGQFLVAAGMFGAHELHAGVTKKTAPFVAAVTEQNGQVPEAFKKPRMTAAEVVAAGIKTGRPQEKAPPDNVKSMDQFKVERDMPSPEDRQARYKEISDKQQAPPPKSPKIQSMERMVEKARADVQKAIDDKAANSMILRLKDDQKKWEKRLQMWQEKETSVAAAKKTASELHDVADEAHAQRLVDKGAAEEKIATSTTGGRPPKGPEPPKTSYEGPGPTPSTASFKAFRELLAPPSLMPKEAETAWTKLWDDTGAMRWDLDRNRDIALKTIPDEGARQQAMKYMTGLPIDPNLPALSGEISKYIEAQRATIEGMIASGKDSGMISANRFRDVLTSMFEDQGKARERLPQISNKAFAKMDPGELWGLFSEGVKKGLKPATGDMATMVNLLETRLFTAGFQQRFKLDLKGGYTRSKAGHLDGFYVPKEVEAVLSNLFDRSIWDEKNGLKFLKDSQARLKKIAVEFSAFHHQAILRATLAANHFDITAAAKGLDLINANDPVVREGASRGLQLRGARPDIYELLRREMEGADPGTLKRFEAWWDKALWEKHVPGAIAFSYKGEVMRLIKSHPDWELDKVYREAVKKTNNSFGLLDMERMGRSKSFQDTLRVLTFAPSWAETRLRMFFGAGQEAINLTRGRGTLADTMYLKQTVGHVLVAGMLGELVNYGLNGPDDKKGSTRRWGEFYVPFMKDKRGKPMIIDSLMFMREPFEMVKESVKEVMRVAGVGKEEGHPIASASKYVMGRRGQIVSWAMEELSGIIGGVPYGADFRHQLIRRPTNTAWENIKATAGHTVSHFVPIILQHTADGLDLMNMEIDGMKDNLGRDMAAFFGFHSRSDYPADLRMKLDDQIQKRGSTVQKATDAKARGNTRRAYEIVRDYNKKTAELEQEIRDGGYYDTLGKWWQAHRRDAVVR